MAFFMLIYNYSNCFILKNKNIICRINQRVAMKSLSCFQEHLTAIEIHRRTKSGQEKRHNEGEVPFFHLS